MTTRGLLLMTAWLLVCGLVASPRIPRFWPGPAGRSLLGRSPYACDSNEVAPCVSSFLRSAGYAPTIMRLVWSACMRCGLRFVLVPLHLTRLARTRWRRCCHPLAKWVFAGTECRGNRICGRTRLPGGNRL